MTSPHTDNIDTEALRTAQAAAKQNKRTLPLPPTPPPIPPIPAKDGVRDNPPLVELPNPSLLSGERNVDPAPTGARVASASTAAGDAGEAAGVATIAHGAGDGGGLFLPTCSVAVRREGAGVEAPIAREWLAEADEEPSSTADSSAGPEDDPSASSPPSTSPSAGALSLTLTEVLAKLEAEALNGAGVAAPARAPLPLPLPLPEARPTNSVGAAVDGGGWTLSHPTSSSIAAKSSVVRPAAAAPAEVLLDVGSCQTLSEVPARTTEPRLVVVAAVIHSLPWVPSCDTIRVQGWVVGWNGETEHLG